MASNDRVEIEIIARSIAFQNADPIVWFFQNIIDSIRN